MAYQRSTLKLFSDDTSSASTVVLESKGDATVFTSSQTLAFNNNVTVPVSRVLTAFDLSGLSHNVGQKLSVNTAAILAEVLAREEGDDDLLGPLDDLFANHTIRGVRTGVSTNATSITANSTSISTNGTNITGNSTAISQEITNRAAAVSAEATLRANRDDALLGVTGNALTDYTIFGCKEAIDDTNLNVSSNDDDIAANLASINTNTANITSNDTDIAANTASIDELKGDLATILDGSSINFDDLSYAVNQYATANGTTGVLDILNNLAERCTHLEGVLDELLNGELGHETPPLNNMPINAPVQTP